MGFLQDRFARLLDRIQEVEVDGLLISHLSNLRYLFGFTGSAGFALVDGNEALLLVDSRYIDQAREQTSNCEPILADPSLIHLLQDLFQKRCRGHKIAVEAEQISYELILRIQSWDIGTELVPTHGLIEELRSIKDHHEIDILKQTFVIAQNALTSFLASFQSGITENEAAARLEYECRRMGGSGQSFDTIVASGKRSALPHGVASAKVIDEGDPVLIDFGIRHDGYCSDMTRVLHRGLEEVRRIYSIVEEAQQAALDRIRPGTSSTEIDLAARQVIERHGYGSFFRHSTGHGIGLEIHEKPAISIRRPCTIETGMVFTVEPGIYLPGKFGVRIEDVVVVTPDGYDLLSQ